ncbi:MAG TPA: YggW family oxidoreductase [Cellvibrionales bacterium]|nr:YggW family oxidoreductase [Cellvibrionales bacterium]HCX26396.1 YggW family oxidoreductase [Cellvibrionales bacterium]
MPPLGLYIHIPWCVKKCPYCDFNSHEHHSTQLPETNYLNALINDLDSELTEVDAQREIHSVFIGGGTPSLLSGNFYIQLFAALNQRLLFSADAEITIEANPGAVDEANFKGFIDAGINRISLGAQSFSDAALNRLGRIHDNQSIYHAFETARNCGFDNINIDLMHGLPEQSLAEGLDDLKAAFELSPEHISWYQLTIEKNTVFYNQPPTLPVENILDNLFMTGLDALAGAGYQQYEVSAFARDSKQSRHNKNYWRFGDYIGIGAGAHGKISGSDGSISRRWKTRSPSDYLNTDKKLAGSTLIAKEDLPLEFMMNALRLNQGFTPQLFEQRTGLSFSKVKNSIVQLQAQGLMDTSGEHYHTTQKGRLFLNNVIAKFSE